MLYKLIKANISTSLSEGRPRVQWTAHSQDHWNQGSVIGYSGFPRYGLLQLMRPGGHRIWASTNTNGDRLLPSKAMFISRAQDARKGGLAVDRR